MKKINSGKNKHFLNLLFLHITVFIYALGSLTNKFASMYMEDPGIFSIEFIISFCLFGGFTVLYAIAWQYNLEKFDLSFLYINKNFYMIWTQIFAVVIMHNKLYWNNIVGLVLIFIGGWVNSKDA